MRTICNDDFIINVEHIVTIRRTLNYGSPSIICTDIHDHISCVYIEKNELVKPVFLLMIECMHSSKPDLPFNIPDCIAQLKLELTKETNNE